MLKHDMKESENTNVYDNKLDITDRDKWESIERDLTAYRIAMLLNNPKLVKQTFDGNHLVELHKYIFQDCYEWAGEYRDDGGQTEVYSSIETRLIDGIDYTAIYTPDTLIEFRMQEINKVIREKCVGRNARIDFVLSILSAVSDRIIAIRPFRRGNTRVRRVFLRQVAERIGFELDYTLMNEQRLTDLEFMSNAVSHEANIKQMTAEERVEMLRELYRPLLVLLPKELRIR